MNKKKTIFYIWGYGSGPNSNTIKYLKNTLGKTYNVISDFYAQYNPKEALFDIENIIKDNDVDLIVASSLGGYLAMQLTGIPKVIINPCVRPDIELPKLTEDIPVTDDNGESTVQTVPAVPPHIIEYYTEYIKQHNVWENYSEEEDTHTVWVFGDNDELLGDRYVDEVKSHASNIVISHQGHGNTQQSINEFVVPAIKKLNI